MHVTLVRSEEKSSIVIRQSHLVVDGGDGKYLLHKLAEAYNLIAANGNADALEIKNGSRAPEKVYDTVSKEDMKKLQKSSPSSSPSSHLFHFYHNVVFELLVLIRYIIPQMS